MQNKGVTVVLGVMDIAPVNPGRFGQGQSPVLSAWFQPRQPTAVTQFRDRLEVCLESIPVDDDVLHQACIALGEGGLCVEST